MAIRNFFLALLIFSVSVGSYAFGQKLILKEIEKPVNKPEADDPAAQQDDMQESKTEKKREWLRENMTSHIKNEKRLHDLNERFDKLSAEEVDQLYVLYQQQLALANRELQQALLQKQQLQQGIGLQQRNVGFAPQITWLPEGASLGVSGVVSPDGRSVRISAMPFFSSIPSYDTFNFATGQTRHYPLQPGGFSQAPYPSGGFGTGAASNSFNAIHQHQIPPSSLRLRTAFPSR